MSFLPWVEIQQAEKLVFSHISQKVRLINSLEI